MNAETMNTAKAETMNAETMNTAKATAKAKAKAKATAKREDWKAIYRESLVQLETYSRESYASLLTLCVSAARLATFENDSEAFKSVWTLPKACKTWQGKARLLLSYLVANGKPQTAKNGKVTYTVSRDAIRIDKEGNLFLPENAKETYRNLVRENDLKGTRTTEKAMALLTVLRWQKEENTQTLSAAKIADMLAGLQGVSEDAKARVQQAIAILRG